MADDAVGVICGGSIWYLMMDDAKCKMIIETAAQDILY